MIELTSTAVEEVHRLLNQEDKEGWGLRVGVVGGGCSGLSYTMAFDEAPNDKDQVMEVEGIQVFIDPKSYLFLNGMTLDFSKELLTGGFKFINPNATRSCSCGTSFSG
jgi:iron-sulfur cluster assembly protein